MRLGLDSPSNESVAPPHTQLRQRPTPRVQRGGGHHIPALPGERLELRRMCCGCAGWRQLCDGEGQGGVQGGGEPRPPGAPLQGSPGSLHPRGSD
jgi:hypothetical protein